MADTCDWNIWLPCTHSIMRNTFYKGNLKTIFYKYYKKFDYKMFKRELSYSLQSFQLLEYTLFHNVFLLLLNKYAPIKKKILRANHSPFMTKTLRKAIIFWSQFKNKFIKSRNNEDWSTYKKQRNFCTNLLKKSEQNYYGQLDMKYLNGGRKFWKIIKHYFWDKEMNSNKMMIIEDILLSEERSYRGGYEQLVCWYIKKSTFEGLFWIKRWQYW